VQACYLIAVGSDVSFQGDPYSEYLVQKPQIGMFVEYALIEF